ncbi:MAG: molybdopterin molybdotransferase MoeA [Acidimicrobiales bacterium]
MIALDEAQRYVLQSLRVLTPREVALDMALGCVATESVTARIPVPGFSNSAMDGYALRSIDTTSAPVRLRVVGALLAGDVAKSRVEEHEAMRIMTGAPLPDGADCVCMIEDVLVEDDGKFVQIPRTLGVDTSVRHAGEDVAVGQALIERGDEIRAPRIGVLAMQGITTVSVHPRPRVGVLSTGDELSRPDKPLTAGKIYDSNRPMIIALLRESGFIPVDLESASDRYSDIAETFRAATQSCDAVVSTGGVSVGDADYVKSVIIDLCGTNARSMQVGIKPGKPFAFGTTPEHTPIFGLPGNPVSTLVSFEMFVRPALRLLAGHQMLERVRVPAVLDCPISRRRDGKIHLVHAVATFHDDGRLHVKRFLRQGSHVLSVVAQANVLLVLPDGEGLKIGDETPAMLLEARQ